MRYGLSRDIRYGLSRDPWNGLSRDLWYGLSRDLLYGLLGDLRYGLSRDLPYYEFIVLLQIVNSFDSVCLSFDLSVWTVWSVCVYVCLYICLPLHTTITESEFRLTNLFHYFGLSVAINISMLTKT